MASQSRERKRVKELSVPQQTHTFSIFLSQWINFSYFFYIVVCWSLRDYRFKMHSFFIYFFGILRAEQQHSIVQCLEENRRWFLGSFFIFFLFIKWGLICNNRFFKTKIRIHGILSNICKFFNIIFFENW